MAETHTLFNGRAFAWTAGRVFDGEAVLLNHAVVVNGGTVTAVLPVSSLPEALPRLSEPDSTILPGLVDAHTHCMRWEAPLFLAHGVTTIRDTGNDLGWILAQRDTARDGVCPAILCVGPILDGPEPIHPVVSRACTDLADAVAAVKETAAAGVDGIKLYVGLSPTWLPAMVNEAHAHGLRASMHCLQSGVRVAAESGIDEFFHLDGILADVWPEHPPGWLNVWGLPAFSTMLDAQRRAADRIAKLGTVATPTLSYWESQWRILAAGYGPAQEAVGVPAEMRGWQSADPDPAAAEQWQRALEAAQHFTALLLERGVPVLAGTDVPAGAQTPGLSLWRELWLLAQAGMPALHALKAATSAVGTFLGRPSLGRLLPGGAADMVVVRGDPTQAIPALPDIVAVMHDGVAYRPARLVAQARQAAHLVAEDPWSVQFRLHSEAE